MKRFYRQVDVAEVPGGWQVRLDGRALKTQGGRPQVVPTQALAQALAQEWAAQGETLDPAAFALRDMADYALDVAANDPATLADKLIRYAETDTLCYRADPGEALFARQEALWEPLLAAFETREGVRLVRVSGVVHRPQPEATLASLRARIAALDPFALAALEQLTTLAHSLSIGLTALDPAADGEALWQAANLEEDWQTELWGEDYEAAEVRARRQADFRRALAFARAAR